MVNFPLTAWEPSSMSGGRTHTHSRVAQSRGAVAPSSAGIESSPGPQFSSGSDAIVAVEGSAQFLADAVGVEPSLPGANSPSSSTSSRMAILPVEVAPPASTGLSIRRRLIRWFHGADKARDEAMFEMAFTIEHQPIDIETAARRAHG